MAANADSVVYEIEAKLNTASARAAEAQMDQSADRIVGSASKAERALQRMFDPAGYRQARLAEALKKTGADVDRAFDKPFLNATTRTRQLGVQIGQMGSSISSGGSIMQAVGQQASDFAYVLGGTQGAAGRVASFFSGPWGAALLAAGLVVANLISRHKEEGESLDDLVEKLRKHAVQSRQNDTANEAFARTTEGVADAIRKNKEALDGLDKSQQSQAHTVVVSTIVALEHAKAVRKDTEETLRNAQAQLARQQALLTGVTSAEGREFAAQNLSAATAEIARLQAQLTDNQAQVAVIEKQVADATSRLAAEAATKLADPIQRIHVLADRAVEAARRQLVAQGLVGAALEKEVAQRTTILRLQEAADVAAANAAKRKPGTGFDQVSTFIMPVQGPITSGFGPRRAPLPGASSFHPAIDIAAPTGTPVHAAAGGVVITAGRLGGLGNVVIVDHGGGTISEYGHLSAIMAQRGQRVGQGDVIGEVGSTGISTGPHLDYRVRVGGKYVDPRGGKFPTDELAAGQKAEQLAQQAQAEAQRMAAREGAYNAEMAQLEAKLLGTQRTKLLSMDEQLALNEQQVIAERDANNSAYASAEKAGRLDHTQAQLLTAKNNELATARAMRLYADEGVRKAQLALQLQEAQEQATIQQLRFEADNAKTGQERREALLRLLDAETELERLKQQAIIDATAAGSAEHELAVLRLAQLGDERARRAYSISQDPQNMSPGERYLQQVSLTGAQINEAAETVAVDGLQKMNDELASALLGTESLGRAWDNITAQILSGIAKIAIQELILKPIAQLLFGNGGGGGGFGGGGLFASIASLFGGGGGGGAPGFSPAPEGLDFIYPGMAGGGTLRRGQTVMVGEHGRELFTPTSDGFISPNNSPLSRASTAANDGGVVLVKLVAGEYFDARVVDVSGNVAVQVVREATPQIAELATARTANALGRRKI